MLKSDLNKTIFKNASWSLIGSIVPKFSIFITSIFLARILGAENFGELSVVRSTINMFTSFATAGIGLTATKYISQYLHIDNKQKVAQYLSLSNFISTILGLLLFFFVFLLSDYIAVNTLKMEHLSTEIQLGAFMLLFNSLNSSQVGILSGFQNFKSIAFNSIASIALTLPLQLYGAYIWGVFGALVGFSFSFVVLYVFNRFSIVKELKNRQINRVKWGYRHVIETLWKFTLPSALSGIMVTPILWVTTIILVRGVNGTYEMGIYEAANQVKMLIIFIPIALSQILLPILVGKLNDKEEYKSLVNKNILINVALSTLISLIIILVSPFVMGLYGKSFHGNSMVLIILSLSTIFMAANNIIGQAIASKDKMWIGFLFNLLWGTVLIMSSYYFITKLSLGAVGLSYAFLLSYVLHTIWQYIYYRKTI